MSSLLFLGFIIGMRHALEADHLAAVATLADGKHTTRTAIRHGAAWGLGHTITLFVFGAIVLTIDTVIPQALAQGLELLVGIMLLGLGADVIRRVYRDRVHYHVHRHDSGQPHFHAHSHRGEGAHERSEHHHDHRFPLRALVIGLIHGMAGSAALILLTLETIESLALGLIYIALFGIGSIVGMAALSVIIAVPMRLSSQRLTWMHNGLQTLIGCSTLGIGGTIVWQSM